MNSDAVTAVDALNVGCIMGNDNCPCENGPDLDVAPPVLVVPIGGGMSGPGCHELKWARVGELRLCSLLSHARKSVDGVHARRRSTIVPALPAAGRFDWQPS